MDPNVSHLRSLEAIRERASIVYDAAKHNLLTNFDYHPQELVATTTFVASIIERDYGPDRYSLIPPHGRWQHFEVGNVPRIEQLLQLWRQVGCSSVESTRRLIDLFFVSVLLDAGAGDTWSFTEPETAYKFERSEGIAVASLCMFNSGLFSAYESPTVTSRGLKSLTPEQLAQGFQTSGTNVMIGISNRTSLLNALGSSLAARSDIFGSVGRPGNLVDFMIRKAGTSKNLDIKTLWDILQDLLLPTWPCDRTTIAGFPLGDAWPLSTLGETEPLKTSKTDPASIQPFHKLTQWLTYSLMVPFERVLGYAWSNTDLLTGLPEYRNGGLFYDMGVLTLKPEVLKRGRTASGSLLPKFAPDDDVIVEWRAMTVALLDVLYESVVARICEKDKNIHLSMAQVLEAGTWKAGREIAAKLRPQTKSSPILIDSDGTVF